MGLPSGAAAVAIGSGLVTALCFGTGDFLAQRLTRRTGWLVAMFAVQVVSAAVLVVVALAWHGLPQLELDSLAFLLAIGLANAIGMIGLYRAFEQGKLSLVSPIAGSMGAFTVAFAWLGGEVPSMRVVPGLGLVLLGIVLASVVMEGGVEDGESARPGLRSAAGVGWALLSAICLGWVFYVLGPGSQTLGPAWSVFVLRLVTICIVVGLARRMGVRLSLGAPAGGSGETQSEQRAVWLQVLVVACLDSGGMVVYALGSARAAAEGQLAVIAVLASAFPLVVIGIARVRLRERLRVWQWVGVCAVLVGVAWVVGSVG